MGLLDVNMPMLYGEGKKAFHRLQLEIIRMSNDHSIFAWCCKGMQVRTGSILADDPSFFWDCNTMQLMNQDEFIKSLGKHTSEKEFLDIPPEEELPSIEDEQFGAFPIMNRGIRIWLFLCPLVNSDSVFQAWLPCHSYPSGPPVVINLASWESNYYQHTEWGYESLGQDLQLCHVYLRFQDTLHCNSTFEINDSVILKKGFTCWDAYPDGQLITGNMVTLSATDPLRLQGYSCRQEHHFTVGFGWYIGQNWVHVLCEEPVSLLLSVWPYYGAMLHRAPVHAQAMKKACFGAASHRVCIMKTHLPRSTWILQISCVMWESSMTCGVKLEVFQDHGFGNVSGEWTSFNVDVSKFYFVHAHYYLIGHCLYREQTIPTVTGGVSRCLFSSLTMS